MGVKRKHGWSLIGKEIHALLKWLYSQEVSVIGLENPEIIRLLKVLLDKKWGKKRKKVELESLDVPQLNNRKDSMESPTIFHQRLPM